jgi:transposase
MGRSYPKEFRDSIINLYANGRSANSLAEEYGVTTQTILRWAGLTKEVVDDESGTTVSIKEYREAQTKIKRLEADLEILKAAALLLGKH